MNKWLTIGGLIFYWLVVPIGVYLFLSGATMRAIESDAALPDF